MAFQPIFLLSLAVLSGFCYAAGKLKYTCIEHECISSTDCAISINIIIPIVALVYLDPYPVLEVRQGEDAVVVCRTNDGGLYWMATGEPDTLYDNSSQINATGRRGIFTVRLDSKNGGMFVSTAVARNVQLMNNASSIKCTDYSLANSRKVTLIVRGISQLVHTG